MGGAVLADRLTTAVRHSPVTVGAPAGDPVSIPITVSIGIAVYPDHGLSGSAVLEAADQALYTAKAAGRDTVRSAPAAATGASRRPQPPRQSRGG